MKSKILNIIAISCVLAGGFTLTGCKDDDKEVVEVSGGFSELPESRDLPFDYSEGSQTVSFNASGTWHVDFDNSVDWVYFSPSSGKAGKNTLKVTVSQNLGSEGRTMSFSLVSGDKKETFTVRQPEFGGTLQGIGQGTSVIIDPASIPDYDKFFSNSEWGPGILKSNSTFSFARYKSSEHFFVFWAPQFGDNPNASTVPSNMRVDIDDLLAKAEQYFKTNIEDLGMAVLGEGKSVLDNYKMQIYLLYQDEWLATGSGYDDMIGALWINPSTCQPVGSTIAHEIGHSFQYQTYADRVQMQGAPNDYSTGFRYGFVGPDGANNGGCVYWEQCAQWQAQRDYPEEQFTSYNFPVWLSNNHRHFHHEWQRYASYWLQSYIVEKHGVEAYGRIWREATEPEDAIQAYTRLYNGGDYSLTREELFDYAMKMATYDITGAREYAAGYQNRYNTSFVINDKKEFQVTYANCPGATGFNVIALNVPEKGGNVKVNFRGLGYGEKLAADDKSNMVNGDGVPQGKPSAYNSVGGAENMGWRYGFVALSGEKRTYSSVGKDANGSLSFDVPAGTEYLFLVVQGSPETYMSHGWDEKESNDPQFPYAITLEGTSLCNYKEPLQASYKEENGMLVATLNVPVASNDEEWIAGEYDIAEQQVADFLGVSVNDISSLILQPILNVTQTPEEGKIVVLNEESDGSYSNLPTANVGYWVNSEGNAVSWGQGQQVYYEINGSVMSLGKLGSEPASLGSVTMRPVFVYTKNGEQKTVKFVITYNFL